MLRYGAFGFLVFLVCLLALMPLKAALMMNSNRALTYQDAFGTIWDGQIYGLSLGGEPVREIEIVVSPLGLLTGRISADWRVRDSSLRGHGRFIQSVGGQTIENTELVMAISRLGPPALPGMDPQARLDLVADRVVFAGDQCELANGFVRTGAIREFARTYGFDGPDLTGTMECRGNALVLTLSGASEDLDVDGEILLRRDSYAWSLTLETRQSDLAELFALAGLRREGGAWISEGETRYAD